MVPLHIEHIGHLIRCVLVCIFVRITDLVVPGFITFFRIARLSAQHLKITNGPIILRLLSIPIQPDFVWNDPVDAVAWRCEMHIYGLRDEVCIILLDLHVDVVVFDDEITCRVHGLCSCYAHCKQQGECQSDQHYMRCPQAPASVFPCHDLSSSLLPT